MRFQHLIFSLVLWLLLAITGGCRTTALNVADDDRFTPAGRVSYEIFPGMDQRRAGSLLDLVTGASNLVDDKPVTARSAGVRPTLSFDGAIGGTRGSDHQTIAAGDMVELGPVIPGPVRLKVSAENIHAHIAVRGGLRVYDVLSLEPIIGVALNSTETRVQGGGIDSREEDLRGGFLFGIRFTLRPIPLFDFYAQYTVTLSNLDTLIVDRQAGVDVNLTQNLALFAGYRWWDYDKEEFDNSSDVDLRFRGPSGGLSLKF